MDERFVETIRNGDGTAIVRLSRPDALNALHAPLMGDLLDAVVGIEHDASVRAYVLVGADRPDGRPCFSAGADLKASESFDGPELGLRVTHAIASGSTPSIALVDGVCSTGGAEIALACDLRIVGEAAQISDWHLKKLGTGLGAWGGSTRWARLIGLQRTKELILTGKVMDAADAVACGFAIESQPTNRLLERGLELARAIAEMDPDGVAMTLAQLELAEDLSRDTAISLAETARRRLSAKRNA